MLTKVFCYSNVCYSNPHCVTLLQLNAVTRELNPSSQITCRKSVVKSLKLSACGIRIPGTRNPDSLKNRTILSLVLRTGIQMDAIRIQVQILKVLGCFCSHDSDTFKIWNIRQPDDGFGPVSVWNVEFCQKTFQSNSCIMPYHQQFLPWASTSNPTYFDAYLESGPLRI